MAICADTSFLYSLYGNDSNTAKAISWLRSKRALLTLTTFNEYELGNALRFAEFRGVLRRGDGARFWAQFEADKASGRVHLQLCNLADIVDEAKRLSASHTLVGGHRGFDILHVAAALRLRAGQFLTFDANQRRLAEAEGLSVPV